MEDGSAVLRVLRGAVRGSLPRLDGVPYWTPHGVALARYPSLTPSKAIVVLSTSAADSFRVWSPRVLLRIAHLRVGGLLSRRTQPDKQRVVEVRAAVDDTGGTREARRISCRTRRRTLHSRERLAASRAVEQESCRRVSVRL